MDRPQLLIGILPCDMALQSVKGLEMSQKWFLVIFLSIQNVTAKQVLFPFCNENLHNGTICRLEVQDDYDLIIAPQPRPLKVRPIVFLKEITNVNVEDKSITMFLEVYVHWKDARISAKNLEWRKISPSEADHFWHPTLQFDKILDLKKQSIFGQPKYPFSFWIHTPENEIQYSEEIQITFTCPMSFSEYPFDVHQCDFTLGDYEYETDEVEFDWTTVWYVDEMDKTLILDKAKKVLYINDTTTPFNFEIGLIKPFPRRYLDEQYSYSGFRIKLERKSIGVLQSSYFIPTGVFAVVSMVSFLIHPESVPGRMGMIVTLLLISSNVYSNVQAPSSRGLSYIEIWIVGSQIPIIFALVQYGFILLAMKYWKKDFDFRVVDFSSAFTIALFYISFNSYFWC